MADLSLVRAVVLMLLSQVALAACDERETRVSGERASLVVDCGAVPVTLTGDPSDPRSIVIENGTSRVTYPQLDSGTDQLGAHMLEIKVADEWHRVLDSWYGDWTYFVRPLAQPAHIAHVITDTPDVVEVAFEFQHTVNVPAIDAEGHVIFPHNYLDTPKLIEEVRFVKTIRVERCATGYFVGYHTVPSLVWGDWIEDDPNTNSLGEREFGLGWQSTVTFASSGTVVRNPEAGTHTSLNMTDQPVGPWWFATLPPVELGRSFVIFIALEHALPSFVWQFGEQQYGIPLVYKMNPQIEADGRFGHYQAYLGAAPYRMTDRSAEPTPEARDLVETALPVSWPK